MSEENGFFSEKSRYTRYVQATNITSFDGAFVGLEEGERDGPFEGSLLGLLEGDRLGCELQ